jgi:DNA repair exonuclease SbcCD ATPase subunit
MRAVPAVLAAAVLAVLPALASSQSLGEVAEREKARREKAREGKARPKVITENELRGGTNSGTLSQPQATDTTTSPSTGATPAPGAAGAKPAEAEKTEEELATERQQEWRQRVQDAQAEVARLRARVDQLQSSLNDLTGNLYGGTRTSLLNQIDQAKSQLTAAEQKVVSLEEEGRRNRYR